MLTRTQQVLKEGEGIFALGCLVMLMGGNARKPGGVGKEALLASLHVTVKAALPYSRVANQTQSQHLAGKLLLSRSLVMNVNVALIQSSSITCVI